MLCFLFNNSSCLYLCPRESSCMWVKRATLLLKVQLKKKSTLHRSTWKTLHNYTMPKWNRNIAICLLLWMFISTLVFGLTRSCIFLQGVDILWRLFSQKPARDWCLADRPTIIQDILFTLFKNWYMSFLPVIWIFPSAPTFIKNQH